MAVALNDDDERMAAPVVVAKLRDEVAQRINTLAREHGVMVVGSVALARALAKEVERGHGVPKR